MKSYSINCQIGDDCRYIAKIIQTSDGGFSLIPKCKESTTAICYRVPSNNYAYESSTYSGFKPLDLMDQFKVESEVKISYHCDGFMQVSGVDSRQVRSGVYDSGRPKGLGLRCTPHINPIESGPTINMLFWGLDHYPAGNCKNSKYNIVFNESDWMRLKPKSHENAYLLELFLFNQRHKSAIYSEDDGRMRFFLTYPSFNGGFEYFNFQVLYLDKSPAFLGVLMRRAKCGFPITSGYSITTCIDLAYRFYLMVLSPVFSIIDRSEQTLNYSPSSLPDLNFLKYRNYFSKFMGYQFIDYCDGSLVIPNVSNSVK